MPAPVTALTLFAGAGGWDTGVAACGVPILAALNHSERSLATHRLNFPRTRQVLTDITTDDPKPYPHATILQASPECCYHADARGKAARAHPQAPLWPELRGRWTDREEDDPATRSRATMGEVVRWAEAKKQQGHPFTLIFVENVPEVVRWSGYHAWLDDMKRLGYHAQTVFFNSMFAPAFPAPCYESRDRWYAVFSLPGVPIPDLDLRPPAFCTRCHRPVGALQAWKNGLRRAVRLCVPAVSWGTGSLVPSRESGAELGPSHPADWHTEKTAGRGDLLQNPAGTGALSPSSRVCDELLRHGYLSHGG